MIYATVSTKKHPASFADLMAHAATIATVSKKYKWPDWAVYDQNFCQEAASNPAQLWLQKLTKASTNSAFLAWQRVPRAGVRPARVWVTLQTAGRQGQAPVPLASDQPSGSKETLPTSQLSSSSTRTTESCLFRGRCCYVHLLTVTKQLRHVLQ